MKTVLKIIAPGIIFVMSIITISANQERPVVVMGEVSYGSVGAGDLEGDPASIYGGSLRGNLINSGAVRMRAGGEALERAKRLREEYNQLNGGRGSYSEKTDAQGNKFWGYEKMEAKISDPQYRIDANIDVTRARHEGGGQDISVTVRIYDIKTGQLAGQTTEMRRNADPYANLQVIGPKPTWMEKYLTGYAREIKYDDPIREAIDKASKTVVDKLSELSGQRGESDADRFEKALAESGYRPIVPDEIRNPRSADKTDREAPAPGTAVSKSDYEFIIDKPGCDPWAVYPETGVYCFTEEEMNAIGASGDLGPIRGQPPTYPFYDGNEPWQAPEETPPVEPETPLNDGVDPEAARFERWMKECYSRSLPETEAEWQEQLRQDMTPGTPCYNSQIKLCKDGTYGLCLDESPGGAWTVPR